jgi:hypothetical protein
MNSNKQNIIQWKIHPSYHEQNNHTNSICVKYSSNDTQTDSYKIFTHSLFSRCFCFVWIINDEEEEM